MKKKTLAIISSILILLILLPSCAKSSSDGGYIGNSNEISTENSSDSLKGSGSVIEESQSTHLTDSADKEEGEVLGENRKIIQNFDLTVQTKEFDALLEKIQTELASCGGYIQESTTHGREFSSDEHRTARMVLRVPAKMSKDFNAFLSENSVVISKNVTTEDVTLSYVDMESRVSALETEKIALEELLKNAASVEEIIKIREKLTDVIYEIESYKSKLRTYDNLVEYCTVSLFINEVERTTVVEKQSVWQEIGTNLKNNFESVWAGAISLFIFLVSAIPFLIPAIVIVLLIVFISKEKKKRKAKKNLTENSQTK